VKAVYYPGLESHPQHNIAKSQMKMFGGVISFEVDGGKGAGIKLVEVYVYVLSVVCTQVYYTHRMCF